jgi:diguanylate cyclase (GGDEF)-like protein
MISLRTKFTLALLFTSFASIILVGAIAHAFIINKFSQISMDQAFEHFQNDITAYISQYGSWENAQSAERFGQFQRRRQALVGNLPEEDKTHLPDIKTNADDNVPPPLLDEIKRPPFRFFLFSTDGKVLMGSGMYEKGEPAPAELMDKGVPIIINDEIVALAVSAGKANVTIIDQAYLNTIRAALMYGLIAAAILAIILGLYFSHRLTMPLKKLNKAIRNMKSGRYHQIIRIHSPDEMGILIESFNDMSESLAAAYNKLKESNTKVSEQAKKLKMLSIQDELTQLYNRRHFDEEADKLFAHAARHDHPVVFMIGDIDYFKNVNDNFSHAMGDKVLCKVSEILKQNIRKNDLLARYGGEEFVIAFPETELEVAANLCERLRQFIKDYTWEHLHPDLNVTISMGLNADTELKNFEQMLAAADKKLYEAKNSGRDKVCY